MNITGCYSLIDDFTSSSISTTLRDPVARVVPLPQDQLQFESGDVLGIYVERHGVESKDNDGAVVLSDGSRSSELVWHDIVDITAAAELSIPSSLSAVPTQVDGPMESSVHQHILHLSSWYH